MKRLVLFSRLTIAAALANVVFAFAADTQSITKVIAVAAACYCCFVLRFAFKRTA